MTKIQVRKQFTTIMWSLYSLACCFQYDEDTSSKAIHNSTHSSLAYSRLFSIWRRYKFESNSQQRQRRSGSDRVVFNMTKIQVRKQFTTWKQPTRRKSALFSIWRRYKFESNSQPSKHYTIRSGCCFQYDEDTSSKAIHNSRQRPLRRSTVVFNMTKIQVRKQFTTGLTPKTSYHANTQNGRHPAKPVPRLVQRRFVP